MAARTFESDIEAGWRGDVGDDAERDALALQNWTLLDVQFKKAL